MPDNNRDQQLDDTEIRRQTQMRESLGKRPSGLTDEQWCEQVVDCGDVQDEKMRGKREELPERDAVSDLDDDDRMSER